MSGQQSGCTVKSHAPVEQCTSCNHSPRREQHTHPQTEVRAKLARTPAAPPLNSPEAVTRVIDMHG